MSWIDERKPLTLSNIIMRSTTDEWRDEMQRFLNVLVPLLTSACIFSGPTQASAETYPVCLAGGAADAILCDYANLAQCKATASGAGGYCVTNPEFASAAYASYRGAGKRTR